MAIIKSSNINLSKDIGKVLNDAGGSVNVNKPLTFFTEEAKINKWAKYKPHIYPSMCKEIGDYNTEDKRCGLTIKYVLLDNNSTYTQNAIRSLYSDVENWSYNLPNGDKSQPFRLSDFVGYQTNSYHLAQGIYTKGRINAILTGEGIFSYPYNCYLPIDSADSEGDGAPFDVTKNLQLSDIDMYIEGGWFNLGDGYLACFVVKQNENPIEKGFVNFNLSSLRLCEKKLKDGGNQITIYDFVTGVDLNTTSKYFWLVGGIVLKGGNYDIFLSMPYFDEEFYHSTCFYTYEPIYHIAMEVTGWSKYPAENTWHDIKWVYTDDYAAFPVSSNSYLKLRVDVDLSSWSSNSFQFTSQNTRINCPQTGATQYCSIYNEKFSIQSSSGLITDSGTLYLGADDLFGMTKIGDEYDLHIQIKNDKGEWKTLGGIGFIGSNDYI